MEDIPLVQSEPNALHAHYMGYDPGAENATPSPSNLPLPSATVFPIPAPPAPIPQQNTPSVEEDPGLFLATPLLYPYTSSDSDDDASSETSSRSNDSDLDPYFDDNDDVHNPDLPVPVINLQDHHYPTEALQETPPENPLAHFISEIDKGIRDALSSVSTPPVEKPQTSFMMASDEMVDDSPSSPYSTLMPTIKHGEHLTGRQRRAFNGLLSEFRDVSL